MSKFNIDIIDAEWQSKIIKIKEGNSYGTSSLLVLIKHFEEINLRTIYLEINEHVLGELLPIVINLGYKFRSYDNGIYQYYKWLPTDIEDKVHLYATSTASAAIMILSPDELSVLMVHEHGVWKFVTGNNNYKELNLETAKREMCEEVGLEIDSKFVPKVVGFWNISGKNGGKINDMMTCYICKSLSETIKMDELEHAQWFKIKDLKLVMNKAINRKIIFDGPLNRCYIEHENEKFGYPYILWLNNWIYKKYMSMNIFENVNIVC